MRAATTPLERLRRKALKDRLAWAALTQIGRLVTYSVGDHVWALFGNSGIQLARVRMATPVAFDGTAREWWWVDVHWPTQGEWRPTHRRVLRSLTPAELHAVREAGVVEARAS